MDPTANLSSLMCAPSLDGPTCGAAPAPDTHFLAGEGAFAAVIRAPGHRRDRCREDTAVRELGSPWTVEEGKSLRRARWRERNRARTETLAEGGVGTFDV